MTNPDADAFLPCSTCWQIPPKSTSERPEFSPPVRIHLIEAQLLIYCIAAPGIEVIRILHAQHNLAACLQDGPRLREKLTAVNFSW